MIWSRPAATMPPPSIVPESAPEVRLPRLTSVPPLTGGGSTAGVTAGRVSGAGTNGSVPLPPTKLFQVRLPLLLSLAT